MKIVKKKIFLSTMPMLLVYALFHAVKYGAEIQKIDILKHLIFECHRIFTN